MTDLLFKIIARVRCCLPFESHVLCLRLAVYPVNLMSYVLDFKAGTCRLMPILVKIKNECMYA